jgi:hypothetical protein
MYFGIFTPYKNCNIETCSHDYATVDEAVFSLCRAEQNRAEPSWGEPSRTELSREQVPHCIASPRCQATAINTWMTQKLKRFLACQIQGFIGVRSSSSQVLTVADSRRRFVVKMKNWRVIRRRDLCVIVEVWNCYSCVLRAVAGKRLVETGKS